MWILKISNANTRGKDSVRAYYKNPALFKTATLGFLFGSVCMAVRF